MRFHRTKHIATVLPLLLGAVLSLGAQTTPASLKDSFVNPPRDARPSVWWHWMYGNATVDGVRKDILWMDRAGIGGFHYFDAGLATPSIVKPRLQYMSPQWKEAFGTALSMADSLGMDVTIASSPGWSVTGGPWVDSDDAEKKLVWRDTLVRGGRRVRIELPDHYVTCGPYQDVIAYPGEPEKYNYYKDICVLAARVKPSVEQPLFDAATYLTSDAAADLDVLGDGRLEYCPALAADEAGDCWAGCDFGTPVTVRSLMVIDRAGNDFALDVSDDGVNWRTAMPTVPMSVIYVRFIKSSMGVVDIPAVTTRFIRLRAVRKGAQMKLSELHFSPQVKVNQLLDKVGFTTTASISDRFPTPQTDDVIAPEDVLDVTRFVKDGRLDWKAPRGTWKIYRFGYTLTGIQNGPASPEATGLEVDKLDEGAMRRYYSAYLGLFKSMVPSGRLGDAIGSVVIDSYESGKCTWTPRMEEQFLSRRGYELRRWMPVLAGDVVGSSEQSEQFLFDWRSTLGDLMVENHYDLPREILAAEGMTYFCESHENGRAFVADGMMCKRNAQVPMGAMWVEKDYHAGYPRAEADVRESSSVAHIYGGNICAAESFSTSGSPGGIGAYRCGPFMMKPVADAAMAQGLNKFIIHSTVHQPYDSLFPGVGLGFFGQWFNRHETWAELARPWTDYLARSSHLMRQGRWVADVAYFYGEDKNATAVFGDHRIPVPEGYNFDLVNADILANVLVVKDGRLNAASGMSYRVLMLDEEVKYMTMETLRRLHEIAAGGVIVCGPAPSLRAGMAGSDEEFAALVDRIWSMENVFTADRLADAMAASGIAPDVRGLEDGLRFVHRTLDDGELYWVANLTPQHRGVTVSLRTCGRRPYILHADSGKVEEAPYRFVDGRTQVKLDLLPDDAQFILLEENTDVVEHAGLHACPEVVATLDGSWSVCFQPGRGAPESIVMDALKPLNEFEEEGVRFFSGTAVYSTSFRLDDIPAEELCLDLGTVHHIACVRVNGQDAGMLWKQPYRTDDIRPLLVKGENMVEVEVTNAWANRIRGDQRRPVQERVTYTTKQFYTAADEPEESGLVGPVRLLGVRRVELRKGDLVFVGIPSGGNEGGMAGAISAATGKGDVNYIHVAMLDVDASGEWVVDATLAHGVDRHPLDVFFSDFRRSDGSWPCFEVMRVRDMSGLGDCVENACRFIGEEYDSCFMPDNGRHYCSELVYDSYLKDGKPVFSSAPMNFKDAEGNYPEYWQRLFKRIGVEIPQGVPGTNPQDMRQSDCLEHVTYLQPGLR